MIVLIPGKSLKESIQEAANNLHPDYEEIQYFLWDLLEILIDEEKRNNFDGI